MTITCDTRSIEVPCTGCYCHAMDVTFGEKKGCCVECGCPKNKAAFDRIYARQKKTGG